ncbi:App1 family protein [Nafulsella turpanensis]|uniref:App1 family protein n=1 Tax=Nafulsella turpanensis TaxID=1265690 RepID=UPI0003466827|nr:phosphatase domain-containing protein [Nafulsella turpanensis]
MADKNELKNKLMKALSQAEQSLSRAKLSFKEQFHLLDPLMILPYYGFGNDHYVFLKGRVLENEKVKEKKEGASTLEHLKNTYKRFESDEIPDIKVKGSFAGQEQEVKTDDEGFFEFEFRFDHPIDYAQHGYELKLQLLETKTEEDEKEAKGYIFVPDKDAEYGVISDIDDTVLVSRVTHFMAKLKLLLLKDATERSPFPGIAAFLRALRRGSDDKGKNALFFVSGSEWNLYDLLINFFRFHDVPEGPLLLRDRGTRFDKGSFETSERNYKQHKIRHILRTYPHLKFICIGDSGQHDPEIYQKVLEEFPGQIMGIYIRDVSPEKRDREVHRIARQVKEKGAEMVLAEETLSAVEHALSMKWINENQLAEIKEECRKDKQEG